MMMNRLGLILLIFLQFMQIWDLGNCRSNENQDWRELPGAKWWGAEFHNGVQPPEWYPKYDPQAILRCNETACMNLCWVMDYKIGGYCILYACQCYGLPENQTMDWSEEEVRIHKEMKRKKKDEIEKAGKKS